jgi:hypothetical protein
MSLNFMPGLRPPTLWCVLIVTDGPPLQLRLFDASQCVEKSFRRVDRDERDAEVGAKGSFDLFALVEAQQARVDEHARELVANRTMHERRSDGGIDAARESADDARRANEFAHFRHFALDERTRCPTRLGVADAEQEIGDDLAAARRVRDLGMKLDAVDRLVFVAHAGDRHALARRCDDESVRRYVDVIAVAHPDGRRLVAVEAVEQSAGFLDHELGASVLAPARTNDVAAGHLGDELHAVTDGENRRDVEQTGVGERRAIVVHRVGAAAQDDAGGPPLADPLERACRGMDFRVDARLAHPAGDQLSELRAVVNNEDARRQLLVAGSWLLVTGWAVSTSTPRLTT